MIETSPRTTKLARLERRGHIGAPSPPTETPEPQTCNVEEIVDEDLHEGEGDEQESEDPAFSPRHDDNDDDDDSHSHADDDEYELVTGKTQEGRDFNPQGAYVREAMRVIGVKRGQLAARIYVGVFDVALYVVTRLWADTAFFATVALNPSSATAECAAAAAAARPLSPTPTVERAAAAAAARTSSPTPTVEYAAAAAARPSLATPAVSAGPRPTQSQTPLRQRAGKPQAECFARVTEDLNQQMQLLGLLLPDQPLIPQRQVENMFHHFFNRQHAPDNIEKFHNLIATSGKKTFIEKIELVRRDEYAGSNLEMARSIFKGKYPKANDKERQQMISFFVHLIGLRREQFNNALRQQREKKTEMGKARDHEAQAVARQRTLDEYHRNEMAKARKNFRVVVKANLDPLTNVLVSHVPGGDPRPRGPNAAVVSRVVGLLGDHDGDDPGQSSTADCRPCSAGSSKSSGAGSTSVSPDDAPADGAPGGPRGAHAERARSRSVSALRKTARELQSVFHDDLLAVAEGVSSLRNRMESDERSSWEWRESMLMEQRRANILMERLVDILTRDPAPDGRPAVVNHTPDDVPATTALNVELAEVDNLDDESHGDDKKQTQWSKSVEKGFL